jgi:hypothetical protein
MSPTVQCKATEKPFELLSFIGLLLQLTPALDGPPGEIEFDMSRPGFFGVSGMVPLISLIRDLYDRGWRVDIVPPMSPSLDQYWDLAGWSEAIRDGMCSVPTDGATFSRIAYYKSHEELNEWLSRILDVLSKVADFQAGVFRAVEWTLNEVADNVLVHAGGVPGWMQAIARPQMGMVEVVVADRGAGIRKTLSEGYPDLQNDGAALHAAIEQGVTRNKSIGQGNGLAGSVRIAQTAHGWANIYSGSAALRLNKDGRMTDFAGPYWQGTIVTINLPTSVPIDVGAALWGYQPFGFFEAGHLNEAGSLTFKVRTEISGFGNRPSGSEAATKLRNLMRDFPDRRILIDFEGVDTPSASFLDEFLAKLVKEEGPTMMLTRFQLVNMNEFVHQTADAVIMQRMSTSHS